MYQRSEEDVVSKAPIVVRLGDTDYKLPVLAINQQREWRREMAESLVPLVTTFKQDATPNTFGLGMAATYLQFPEKLQSLVFSYDLTKVIDREKVLNEATDEQFAVAFARVMAVAFPFGGQLATLVELVKEAMARQ